MTNQAQAKNDIQLIDEEQVIDYIKDNPDFFIRHSSLLAEIEIPHESGSAISLIERQLSVLRDKNKKLDKVYSELQHSCKSSKINRTQLSLQYFFLNFEKIHNFNNFLLGGDYEKICFYHNGIRNVTFSYS